MSFFVASALPALHFLLGTKTTTKSSSSSEIYLFIFVILFGGWLLLRSQRNKARQQQMAQQRAIEIGDEVVTTSGIVGRVATLSEDRIGLEVAPGMTIEVLRHALGRRLEPPVSDYPETETETETEADTDNHGENHDSGDELPPAGESS